MPQLMKIQTIANNDYYIVPDDSKGVINMEGYNTGTENSIESRVTRGSSSSGGTRNKGRKNCKGNLQDFTKSDETSNEKNIYISRNKDLELDIYDPYKYVQKKVEDVLYLKFGDKSNLFCDPCFKNENVYHDPNDDNLSINNNQEMDDIEDFDENDLDEEENNEYNDAYYVRRGKYDMY